jgi:hypothetical protein
MNRRLRRAPDGDEPGQARDRGDGKPIKSLRALAQAESDCRHCPLYRDATQAVPGEGPSQAGDVAAAPASAGQFEELPVARVGSGLSVVSFGSVFPARLR